MDYYNKAVSLLPPLKVTPAPSVIPVLPNPNTITFLTYVWHFMMRCLNMFSPLSKPFHYISLVLQWIQDHGYYSLIDTGVNVIHITHAPRALTVVISNTHLMYREIYIGLFFLLKANRVLDDGRVVITFAHTQIREFTLHNNIL